MIPPGFFYVPGSQVIFPTSSSNAHSKSNEEANEFFIDQHDGQDHRMLSLRAGSRADCKNQTCGPKENLTYCGIPSKERQYSDRTDLKSLMCKLCWPKKDEYSIERHCRKVDRREEILLYTLLGLLFVFGGAAVVGMICRRYLDRRVTGSSESIASNASSDFDNEGRLGHELTSKAHCST